MGRGVDLDNDSTQLLCEQEAYPCSLPACVILVPVSVPLLWGRIILFFVLLLTGEHSSNLSVWSVCCHDG